MIRSKTRSIRLATGLMAIVVSQQVGVVDGRQLVLAQEHDSGDPRPLDPKLRVGSNAAAPSPRWLDQARAALGPDLELARRVRRFRGTLEGADGEARDVQVATLTLRAPLEGGILGVAVDSAGEVVASRLWGRPELDADALNSWSFLLEQFTRQPRMNAATAISSASPAAEGASLALEARAGRLDPTTQAIYRLRLLMRDNSYRYTVGHKLPTGLDTAFLTDWRRNFDEILRIATVLEPILGERAAGEYREAARRGSELLAGAVDASAADDQAAIRRATRLLYRESCERCHQIEQSDLGAGRIYFLLRDRFDALGIRGDVARVGVDVYAIPDAPPAASQEVATALRITLLVLGQPVPPE